MKTKYFDFRNFVNNFKTIRECRVSANTRDIQKSQQICSQAATSTDRRGIRHTQIDRTADTLTPQAAADGN